MSAKKSNASRVAKRVRDSLRVLRGKNVSVPCTDSKTANGSGPDTASLAPSFLAKLDVGEIMAPRPAGLLGKRYRPVDRIWWQYLSRSKSKDMFPEIDDMSARAVENIRSFYGSNVEKHGITSSNFFGGSIKNDEAYMLHRLIAETKPKCVIQIGTFIGYSAAIICDALRSNGEGHLICIDPEIPHRSEGNPVDIARLFFDQLGLDDFVTFRRGWSTARGCHYLGPQKRRQIPVIGRTLIDDLPDGIDFAFIDGDHSTAYTLMDYHLIQENLNVGGTALFHDVYSWPTVAQAISVIWNDIVYFEKGTSAYFDLDVRQGIDGLAILRRKLDD